MISMCEGQIVHAGISVGEDSATHQCNEDIALMRTIPVINDNPAWIKNHII